MGRQGVQLDNHKVRKAAGGLLLGAAATGALAVVALGSAGAANASCASFSGINSSSMGLGHCTTKTFGDTAIGIGTDATAVAEGGFNTAIAIGNPDANAYFGDIPTAAVAQGTGNTAVALGNGSAAESYGVLSSATVLGKGSTAITGGKGLGPHGSLNRASVIGDHSIAMALGGDSTKGLSGIGNNSAIVLGNQSVAAVNYPSATKTNIVALAIGNHKTLIK